METFQTPRVTFFPRVSVDLCWRKRHERQQRKHKTTRRRTTRIIIIITTLPLLPLSGSFLWRSAFVCRSFVLLQRAFVLNHQRYCYYARSIFSLSSTFRGGNVTTRAQNDTNWTQQQHLASEQSSFLLKRLSSSAFRRTNFSPSPLSPRVLLLEQQVGGVFVGERFFCFRRSFLRRGRTIWTKLSRVLKWDEDEEELSCVETEQIIWHQRHQQRQTPEWDDVFRSKTDGTRRDLFTSLC